MTAASPGPAPVTPGRVSPVHVTTDGGTHWLECFHDDPDAGHGTIIANVEPGDSWSDLSAKVREHEAEHHCGEATAKAVIAAHAAHDEDSDQHYTGPENS